MNQKKKKWGYTNTIVFALLASTAFQSDTKAATINDYVSTQVATVTSSTVQALEEANIEEDTFLIQIDYRYEETIRLLKDAETKLDTLSKESMIAYIYQLNSVYGSIIYLDDKYDKASLLKRLSKLTEATYFYSDQTKENYIVNNDLQLISFLYQPVVSIPGDYFFNRVSSPMIGKNSTSISYLPYIKLNGHEADYKGPTIVTFKSKTKYYYYIQDANSRRPAFKIFNPENKTVDVYYEQTDDYSAEIVAINEQITFLDIEKHPAKKYIIELASNYIVNGTGNSKFSPNKTVTRAEFSAMLSRALTLKPTSATSKFKDAKGKWFEQEVRALADYGIINGTSATTFSPNNNITRAEVSLMLNRLLTKEGKGAQKAYAYPFKDGAGVSDEAKQSIGYLKQLNIISTSANANFGPSTKITRGEMAELLAKTLASLNYLQLD